MMLLSCDRTGFPLITVPDLGVEMQLLPLTKLQVADWLATSTPFGDAWYDTVLAINPDIPCSQCSAANRERLFLTGLLPAEVLVVAQWLGDGFDVPTVELWRALYDRLAMEVAPSWDSVVQLGIGPARHVLAALAQHLQPTTLVELALLHGGLIEWVRHGQSWVGLGAPRPQFYPNVFDPRVDVVRPLRAGERLAPFGMRLVRRISAARET